MKPDVRIRHYERKSIVGRYLICSYLLSVLSQKADQTRVHASQHQCHPLTCRISRLLPMPSSVQRATTCSGLQHPEPSSSPVRTLWPTVAISREGVVERPERSSQAA